MRGKQPPMKKVVIDLFWGRPVGKHAEGLVKDVIWLFVKSQGLMQNNPKPTAALHTIMNVPLPRIYTGAKPIYMVRGQLWS